MDVEAEQDMVLAPARDQKARAFREARRSGVLSLPARNLTEFPTEAYRLEEHMDKDEKKWECVDLVKIDLSHNAIPSISDDISELTTVTSLKLCKNALERLPDGLFQLSLLTYLDLSHNKLQTDLSELFGSLTQLKDLALSGNQLTKLPESIARLRNLEALRVEENMLTKLPDEIGSLAKLHTLTAHSNQLTSLPPSFTALQNMQTLDLKKNRLETASNCLSTLSGLKYLDLRQNRLVVFPVLPEGAALDQAFLGYNTLSSIDEASILRVKDSITVLDLRDNKLDALPANLACLYRLKTLDLSNNDLADIPPGLGYLKHLNHIILDGNPLRAIRRSVLSSGCEALKKYLRTRGSPPVGVDVLEEEVDELQVQRDRERAAKAGLSEEESAKSCGKLDYIFREANSSGTLDLTGKGFAVLPQEIGGRMFASTLLHLNLSKNRLIRLPASVGELHVLVTLTVEESGLQQLDSSIADLPRLQMLRVRKNQLTNDAVDAFIGNSPGLAESLKEFDLRNNVLTEMPMAIRYLFSLETLLLSFNRIETLESYPWLELSKLSVLSISDNRLRSLGTVHETPLLASISFENNNLTQIPCELGLCPHLRAIYMNGNPQKTVRGGIIAKGSMEIITYLKNKLPPGAILKTRAVDMLATPRKEPSASAVVVTIGSRPTRKSPGNQPRENSPDKTASDQSGSTNSELRSLICTLTDQIAEMELELENHALSQAKRFAMKKEVAMLRSQRIRTERQIR